MMPGNSCGPGICQSEPNGPTSTGWIASSGSKKNKTQANGGTRQKWGGAEVNRYLTYLAVERKVSASTQNQALSALLFLFREVLQRESLKLDAIRAKKPDRLPVVLTRDEVREVLLAIPLGPKRLAAGLMYGSGRTQRKLIRS